VAKRAVESTHQPSLAETLSARDDSDSIEVGVCMEPFISASEIGQASPESLRQAILISEILGPPVALRQSGGGSVPAFERS
jgi:hypothetical protein